MTFDRAAKDVVPYLERLGVSHLYASPIFTAIKGSTHGYDVVDQNELDPDLGGREGFDRMIDALRHAGLGLILDIVPNHMAASLQNGWWRSVVEWGEASPFATHFDIDWSERLTLPILGRPYEDVLSAGELTLAVDARNRCLALSYFDDMLPLCPSTYGQALSGVGEPFALALAEAATKPFPDSPSEARIRNLLSDQAAASGLAERLRTFSGDRSFIDALHAAQPWRLMFWKEARSHLSYRRFFEVTGLVGVRVEDNAVFDDVHRLTLELVRTGLADGLRIDHIDGLAEPQAYLSRLRKEVGTDCYLVVEKILGKGELLPPDWPVEGTTGYEFIAEMADLLTDAGGMPPLDRAYEAFVGYPAHLEEERREAKRLILCRNFETELRGLVRIAENLAIELGRTTRDLESTIVEMIVAFPVYRTYGDRGGMPDSDRSRIEMIAAHLRKADAVPEEPLEFLVRMLRGDVPPEVAARAALLRIRFQQLTGPVMAKAVEDTLFYRHGRFIPLNEVGCDPARGGGTLQEFHKAMIDRARLQPNALSTTATHDTKRGEDARARLYAISEAAQVWGAAVTRWSDMHRNLVGRLRDGTAPEAEVEWFLYQALAGAWPEEIDLGDTAALGALSERFLGHVEKSLREAKLRTSWTDISEPYESAVRAYAERLLEPQNRGFLSDFATTLRPFILAGHFNSLTQTLVKLTAPGIPDIYQGAEMLDLSMVDPDNRRPVDFATLLLTVGLPRVSPPGPISTLKQHLVATCLRHRRRHPDLFEKGTYEPLEVEGPQKDRLVCYMRVLGSDFAVALGARRTMELIDAGTGMIDRRRWKNTAVRLPRICQGREMRDVLTGRRCLPKTSLSAADHLSTYPVALIAMKSGTAR
jgi:(1->4)-alpha-D-glucan 1-alpha-D-glucosylmutase